MTVELKMWIGVALVAFSAGCDSAPSPAPSPSASAPTTVATASARPPGRGFKPLPSGPVTVPKDFPLPLPPGAKPTRVRDAKLWVVEAELESPAAEIVAFYEKAFAERGYRVKTNEIAKGKQVVLGWRPDSTRSAADVSALVKGHKKLTIELSATRVASAAAGEAEPLAACMAFCAKEEACTKRPPGTCETECLPGSADEALAPVWSCATSSCDSFKSCVDGALKKVAGPAAKK